MANPTSELLVKVATDTKQLKAGLASADKQTKGFAQNIQRHSKAIGVAMIAVGTAIMAAAAKSVLSYAKMGDEAAKMAKRTGFSTEALSELRYATEIAGADLGSLEKATKRMSKTIVDASEGMATYIRAFDRIGVSVDDLMGKKPEDQFMTIAMAIAALEDETMKAATSQDIFGRAGTRLLPLFLEGADKIESLRQEAHDLGIVFDAEAALAAEEFTDAMLDFNMSVKGAQFAIAEALLPTLKPLIDKVTDAAKGIGEFAEENEALTQIVVAGGPLLVGLGGMVLILPKLIGLIKAAKVAVMGLASQVALLTAGFALLGYGIYALLDRGKQYDAMMEAADTYNKLVTESQGKVTEELIEAARAYKELREAYGYLAPEEEEQMEHLRQLIELYDEGNFVLNETTGFLELYKEGLHEATDGADELALSIEALTDKHKKLRDSVNETMGALAKLFPGGFTEEEFEKWKPFFEQIERRLVDVRAVAYKRKKAQAALGIPGFAEGGVVTSPTLAMIGEGGPEAIIPLEKAGGGNITINFTEPVFMEREESINKLADRIYRVIKKEQRLSFGGAYSG